MTKIVSATLKDISTIQELSNIVWPITFAEILSEQQIKYMMEMMYSTEALAQQMTVDNHQYILAQKGDEYMGYLAYQTNVDHSYTKIHKIYVLPIAQGMGVGRQLINYVKTMASNAGDHLLRLNVNRYNKALTFYQKIGFSIECTENIDIGNGYLMEDYAMKMDIIMADTSD